MNKNKLDYQDDLMVVFGLDEEAEFLQEVSDHRDTQRKLIVLPEDFKVLTKDDGIHDIETDVMEDTEKNIGLYLSNGEETVPLRNTAIYALDTICEIGGRFLKHITAREHADVLNQYVIPNMKKDKKVLLFIEDMKVTGVMCASTYKELPALDVFSKAKEYLMDNFPDYRFKSGTFSHEFVSAAYDLSAHSEEFNTVLNGVRYKPVLNIQTSDCGLSSVTLRPYVAGENVQIPIRGLPIPHRGNKDMAQELKEAFDKSYSLIDKGVSDLKRLTKIVVEHPHTTLLRVMKDCKINKKAGLSCAEAHKDEWQHMSEVTAFDLYRVICETLMYMPEGQTEEQKFRASDDVARAAAVNWPKHDLPGDFCW